MPNYKVMYKTDADPDHRYWPLGPHPARNFALGTFNSAYAGPEGLGEFVFDKDGTTSDYTLVEQEPLNRSETMWWLYKAA
jgi:hypothetical protein